MVNKLLKLPLKKASKKLSFDRGMTFTDGRVPTLAEPARENGTRIEEGGNTYSEMVILIQNYLE